MIVDLDDERFAVVDQTDAIQHYVTGKKALHSLSEGLYHRSVHVFIEVIRGKFMIQLKGTGTENSGKLSSAVSGHVRAGEDYTEAAVRETKEEIGLDIDPEELQYISTIAPCAENGYEFSALFVYLMDDTVEYVKPNPNEVKELHILRLKDVVDDSQSHPEKYSPAFLALFEIFWEVYVLNSGKSLDKGAL
jgi:isopentenyl-diphosphate Delta-isomerase